MDIFGYLFIGYLLSLWYWVRFFSEVSSAEKPESFFSEIKKGPAGSLVSQKLAFIFMIRCFALLSFAIVGYFYGLEVDKERWVIPFAVESSTFIFSVARLPALRKMMDWQRRLCLLLFLFDGLMFASCFYLFFS